jgi:cytochrome P450
MGWNWALGGMRYNSDWKDCRRLLNQDFNARNTHVYHPKVIDGAREVCRRLIEHPEKYTEHLRQ